MLEKRQRQCGKLSWWFLIVANKQRESGNTAEVHSLICLFSFDEYVCSHNLAYVSN